MTVVARVTLTHGSLTDDSIVTIVEDGVELERGPVPVRDEVYGVVAPPRIGRAVETLGWRPVDGYQMTDTSDWCEFEVQLRGADD